MNTRNAPKTPGISGPDSTVGGASGEGAESALQVMLKKRQMRIDPSTDATAPSPSPQPGALASGRKIAE